MRVCSFLFVSVQMRAYEKLSWVHPAVTLSPVDTVKLENVCEYQHISGLLLPYIDGLSLVWGYRWPELLDHRTRIRLFEKMAMVRRTV